MSAGYSSKIYQNLIVHLINRSTTSTYHFLNFDLQGVRRLGAAAVDMCHVALGIVEAYWEYRLKPWDMAAGVLVCFLSYISSLTIVQSS